MWSDALDVRDHVGCDHDRGFQLETPSISSWRNPGGERVEPLERLVEQTSSGRFPRATARARRLPPALSETRSPREPGQELARDRGVPAGVGRPRELDRRRR
jgi:hypothetical protein